MYTTSKLKSLLASNKLIQTYNDRLGQLINKYLQLNLSRANCHIQERALKDIMDECKKLADYNLNKEISSCIKKSYGKSKFYNIITSYSKTNYEYYQNDDKELLLFNTCPIICNPTLNPDYYDGTIFYKYTFCIDVSRKIFAKTDCKNTIIDSYCLWTVRDEGTKTHIYYDEKYKYKVKQLHLLTSIE